MTLCVSVLSNSTGLGFYGCLNPRLSSVLHNPTAWGGFDIDRCITTKQQRTAIISKQNEHLITDPVRDHEYVQNYSLKYRTTY